MPPEGKYTSLPLRPQRDPYRSAPYPLTRGSPTPRLSKHSAELPAYSAAYADPNEKWAPKRRASGDGKDVKDVPIIMDISEPDKAHPEVVSPSSNSQPIPPPFQKSHTTPAAYMPQTQNPATTPRVPLSRALRIQPDHKYNRPVEKHRSTRKQSSFYKDLPRYYEAPTRTTYDGGSRTRGSPMVNVNRKGRNSPLPVPKKITFRPSISPPPDIPLVQVSPPPSPGSRKTKRRPKVRPSQGDAVLIGVMDNGRHPDIATMAGQEALPSDSEEVSSSPDTDSSMDESEIMADKNRTLATSPLSQSNSELSASRGGLSRGRQLFRPLKARRLASVANRGTISKDNTIGDEARTADILANMGKKICKTPQSMKKLPPIKTAWLRSNLNPGIARPTMEELADASPEIWDFSNLEEELLKTSLGGQSI